MVQRYSLQVQRRFGLRSGAKANFYRIFFGGHMQRKGAGAQQSIRHGPCVAWVDAMLGTILRSFAGFAI